MYAKINGLKINYKITGEGERTAVMLQGWGTTMEMYDSVAACVSDGMRFVQLDLPGFGHERISDGQNGGPVCLKKPTRAATLTARCARLWANTTSRCDW